MKSEVWTPLVGFSEGGDLKSMRLIRQRLMVPFERRHKSVTKLRVERRRRIFHGSLGDIIVWRNCCYS